MPAASQPITIFPTLSRHHCHGLLPHHQTFGSLPKKVWISTKCPRIAASGVLGVLQRPLFQSWEEAEMRWKVTLMIVRRAPAYLWITPAPPLETDWRSNITTVHNHIEIWYLRDVPLSLTKSNMIFYWIAPAGLPSAGEAVAVLWIPPLFRFTAALTGTLDWVRPKINGKDFFLSAPLSGSSLRGSHLYRVKPGVLLEDTNCKTWPTFLLDNIL